MAKKRIVKDYEKLPENIVQQLKLKYPEGFIDFLISYTDAKGQLVSALPFEAEEAYYLIRMTPGEAVRIIDEDDDYDNDGILKDSFQLEDIPDQDNDDFDEDDE